MESVQDTTSQHKDHGPSLGTAQPPSAGCVTGHRAQHELSPEQQPNIGDIQVFAMVASLSAFDCLIHDLAALLQRSQRIENLISRARMAESVDSRSFAVIFGKVFEDFVFQIRALRSRFNASSRPGISSSTRSAGRSAGGRDGSPASAGRHCPAKLASHPVRSIRLECTSFRVSKIPSMTFSLPANSSSGPPACKLLNGGS